MFISDHDDFHLGSLSGIHEDDASHVNWIESNLPQLLEVPAEDDWEVGVFGEHDSARYSLGSDLNWPFTKIGDSIEPIRSRRSVLWDESMVQCE